MVNLGAKLNFRAPFVGKYVAICRNSVGNWQLSLEKIVSFCSPLLSSPTMPLVAVEKWLAHALKCVIAIRLHQASAARYVSDKDTIILIV